MAGVKASETVLENLRALELYMRTSASATLFLDCFYFEKDVAVPHIALRNVILSPSQEDIQKAEKCETHLQRLFALAEQKLGHRIHVEPVYEAEDVDKLYMHATIMLDDPRLADVLLDLAAQISNERHPLDTHPEKTAEHLRKIELPKMSELTGLLQEKTDPDRSSTLPGL